MRLAVKLLICMEWGAVWPLPMVGRGMGIPLGTKGAVLAERTCRLGSVLLLTLRLLKTAETPSPNSTSGELFLGVLQIFPSVPGRGRLEGCMMWLRVFLSLAVILSSSVRSRNSSWLGLSNSDAILPAGTARWVS